MTTQELVQRVKVLPNDTAAIQVEKFVTELLKPSKLDSLLVRSWKRRVIAKLKRLRDE